MLWQGPLTKLYGRANEIMFPMPEEEQGDWKLVSFFGGTYCRHGYAAEMPSGYSDYFPPVWITLFVVFRRRSMLPARLRSCPARSTQLGLGTL